MGSGFLPNIPSLQYSITPIWNYEVSLCLKISEVFSRIWKTWGS
jgi:hypothetical protein